jgi:hypothetical protein
MLVKQIESGLFKNMFRVVFLIKDIKPVKTVKGLWHHA